MTYRYILIDDYSGFVWGEAIAADPIAACQAVDASIGEGGRCYEDIGSERFDGRSGYRVYIAAADFPEVTDGQDQESIDAVEALGLEACVTFTSDAWCVV